METATCQQIYASVEQRCPLLDLGESWQRMPSHPAFRLWTPDVIDALRGEFAEHDLIAAGIMQGDTPAGAVLADYLHAEQPILPLRTAADQLPAQLVVGEQVLPQGADACLAILRDYRLQDLAKTSHGATFVASSLREMAVMWACRLTTTLGSGLETLSIPGLRWLAERVEQLASLAERPADEDDEEDEEDEDGGVGGDDDDVDDDDGFDPPAYPPSLVYVDWTPRELEPARQAWIVPIWRHVAAAERHCPDLELRQKIWSPGAESLEPIVFCLTYGEASDIVRAMIDSSQNLHMSLPDRKNDPPQKSEPPSYLDAHAQWRQSIDGYYGTEHTHRRWEQLLAAIERQYVGPVLARSMAVTDPIKRNRLLLLAQVLGHLHFCWLRAEQITHSRAQSTRLTAPARTEELRNLLALQSSALQMIKDLYACPHKTTKRR
jgi:hypothetical protein